MQEGSLQFKITIARAFFFSKALISPPILIFHFFWEKPEKNLRYKVLNFLTGMCIQCYLILLNFPPQYTSLAY